MKNPYGVITGIDARTTEMLGWDAAEIIGHRSLEFMHPGDHDRAVAQWLEGRSSQATQRVRVRHRHRDGHWVWVEVENTFVGVDDVDAAVITSQMTDISDEMAAHETIRQQGRLLRRVADSLPIGLIVFAADRSVVFTSAGLRAVLGLDSVPSLAKLLDRVHADARIELARAVAATLDTQTDAELEVALTRNDGNSRRCLITLASLSDDEGLRGAVASITDITASSRLHDELTLRATRDPLTGCQNRGAIQLELQRTLNGADGHDTALLFIDLDRFKAVNDVYGHQAGDRLLVEVTGRLIKIVRTGDAVGRWGGDEFIVICRRMQSLRDARAVADRLAGIFNTPVNLGGPIVNIGGSIGVAMAKPGLTAEELLAQADAAMYSAKRSKFDTPMPYVL